MPNVVKSAVDSGHGTALLYAAAFGLLLSDALPTPADSIYFRLEKKLRDKWDKGELTPKQYWWAKAGVYYVPNVLWWSLVLGTVVYAGRDFNQKWKIGLGLISGGVVFAVLSKNISQDVKQNAQQRMQYLQQLAKQAPLP